MDAQSCGFNLILIFLLLAEICISEEGSLAVAFPFQFGMILRCQIFNFCKIFPNFDLEIAYLEYFDFDHCFQRAN